MGWRTDVYKNTRMHPKGNFFHCRHDLAYHQNVGDDKSKVDYDKDDVYDVNQDVDNDEDEVDNDLEKCLKTKMMRTSDMKSMMIAMN